MVRGTDQVSILGRRRVPKSVHMAVDPKQDNPILLVQGSSLNDPSIPKRKTGISNLRLSGHCGTRGTSVLSDAFPLYCCHVSGVGRNRYLVTVESNGEPRNDTYNKRSKLYWEQE